MMPRSLYRARRRDAKGQVLVLFALVLVVLLLVSALAIDYGAWLVAKRNYQNLADSASLAGAQLLTRPLANTCLRSDGTTVSKNECARQASWESIRKALNLSVNPTGQAAASSATPYEENGYRIWVASPPSQAGSAWLGKITGPGVVYVRVEHAGASYLSRLASVGSVVTSWATAGRFPANFAVIGMCRPAAGDACLANDSNISINGNGTYLALETGDLGTNAWVKTNGNGAAVGLGSDSNAYMEEFNDCWDGGQQCELVGWNNGLVYTDVRTAIPLGAPIVDPGYVAPPISNITTPAQCRGTASGGLAMAPSGDSPPVAVENLPIVLARSVKPLNQPHVAALVPTTNDVVGFVKASVGGAPLNGMTVTLTNGAGANYNVTTSGGGPNAGRYTRNNVDSGTYTITASDPSGVYHAESITLTIPTASTNTTFTAPDILLQKNPTISGTINSSAGGTVNGANISITGAGGPYTATSGAGGAYGPVVISGWGATNTWDVNVSATNFTANSANSGFLTLGTNTVVNVTLTPAPATLTGTITDQVTGLAIPNVTVTLTGGTAATTTTNASGVYNFGSVTPGNTTTITLTNIDGYYGPSPSTATNPTTPTLSVGANTVNFSMWPKGCGTGNGDRGDWNCSWPAGNNCGTVVNQGGGNVTCSKFDNSNAIRPGTYNDIDISGCAWLDARGGQTGLAPGQSAGIYHIRGSFKMSNNAYIFGDGVTLVFDQGAEIDVQNSGGFVLNYGTHNDPTTPTCDRTTSTTFDLTTQWKYGDTGDRCFRTVPTIDGMDYNYTAWTTDGESPWSAGPFPTYDDSVVNKGKDLGITFYAYGDGFGNSTRFRLNTAGMGYLFNGVLYAPRDDIDLGGGHNAQNAAGQLVGWTIKYHGGTKITQNWYGDPIDGPPFLIEPILGQ